jgi:hypothetical protein
VRNPRVAVMFAALFVSSASANRTLFSQRDVLDEYGDLCSDQFLDAFVYYCKDGDAIRYGCRVQGWECNPEYSSDSSIWNLSCRQDEELCVAQLPKVRDPMYIRVCYESCSSSGGISSETMVTILAIALGGVVLIDIVAVGVFVCCCCGCCACCGCCGSWVPQSGAQPSPSSIVDAPFAYHYDGYAGPSSSKATA